LMTAEESKDSANGDKACCKYGNSYWYVQKLVDVFRWNYVFF
jgi:hypothetical protein